MKKRYLFLIIAVVLLISVFPCYSGMYKDGGTKVYSALTYKIVKWKRITHYNGVDVTYVDTKVYFFPHNFKGIDELYDMEEQQFDAGKTSNLYTYKHIYCIQNDTLGSALTYEQLQQLDEILSVLDYDKSKLCYCMPEYEIDMGKGIKYGIHITEGYARCDKGQAELTQEQLDIIYDIIRKTNKALD